MKLKVIYKNGVPFAIHNEKEYQFELEKDELEKMALEYASLPYKNWPKDAQVILLEDNARLDFIAGYKAAQSKGCFTEEDMRIAFDRGEWDGSGKSEATRNAIFDDFIDSLKQPKKLVAIEVETERRNVLDIDEQGQMAYTTIDALKSSNALLTIKQYFYE